MASVVQLTCPGCKQPLRIPSDWLARAVRCKHCGRVLQAKAAAAAPKPAAGRPAVSAKTPTPTPRTVQTSPAAPATPPIGVTTQAAAPVAIAAVAAPSAGGSPFDTLEADAAASARPSRYRRRRASWWKGPAIGLSVFAVAGLVTYFCWGYIRDALQAPPEPPARVHEHAKPDGQPDKPKEEPTPRPKDKETTPVPNPKDPGDKPNEPTTRPTPPDSPKNAAYPRRALVISVQNYLYANPVHAGMPLTGARNIPRLRDELEKGLHVRLDESAHLSDGADKSQGPRAPMKAVIEKTLTDFLNSSRAQDRVLVFFIGHAVMVGDDGYLAPIEGELDNADTLIPLKWVYEQLAKCKARQKVLVMDVNRLSPSSGLERPNGGPMDPKMDALLAAPPDGVQVWTACLAGQQSYELDDEPEGAFLDALYTALTPGKDEKGLQGVIQHPEDSLPLDKLVAAVNANLKEQLSPEKLVQQSRLAGAEPKDGAAYDKAEAPAPSPALAAAPTGDPKAIQSVLNEIGVPPVKASNEDTTVRFDVLPPFPPDKMAAYLADGGDMTDLRKAVVSARQVIWALHPSPPPPDLADAVAKIRKDVGSTLAVLKDGYKKPADENKFKEVVRQDELKVADMIQVCEDALAQLKAAGENRDKETKRWQANYDFMLARLEAQEAYLWEYDSALGQMRKALPDLAPGETGWKLAAAETLKGDSQGKNLAKASRKLLDQIAKDNPGTPWEVLAKREKLTALGLEWQGSKGD